MEIVFIAVSVMTVAAIFLFFVKYGELRDKYKRSQLHVIKLEKELKYLENAIKNRPTNIDDAISRL